MHAIEGDAAIDHPRQERPLTVRQRPPVAEVASAKREAMLRPWELAECADESLMIRSFLAVAPSQAGPWRGF